MTARRVVAAWLAGLCLALIAGAHVPVAAASGYTFAGAWGTRGSGAGEFIAPKGIAEGADGSLYVCDYANDFVGRYAPDGTLLGSWGEEGTQPGQFHQPSRLAIGPDGSVYVADTANYRVQRFTSSGRLLGVWGTKGSGNGQFRYPRGVAVDAQGRVYVTDQFNGRVQVFTADGRFIRAFGSPGEGVGRLLAPKDVAVSPEGRVYVLDAEACDIEVFSATGASLGRWGGKGQSRGKFLYPRGLAVDGRGHIFVADSANDRVQEFAPDRSFVREWGCSGKLPGLFNGPRDVAPARDGSLYISDTFNERVEHFTRSQLDDSSAPGTIAHWGGSWLEPARRVTWTEAKATVTLAAADADGAPLTTYGRSDSEFFEVPEAPVELTDQGIHRIDFLSVDSAGNQEVMRYRLLGVDWTAPNVSWAGGARLTATPGATVGLSLWAGDNLSPRCRIGLSAVRDGHVVAATHLGTVVTHVTPRRVTLTWTCPERLGTYQLLLSDRDRAGNESVVTASLAVR